MLSATAVIYLWHVNISGMANEYYSAAALAGSQSWKAFFFGSLDASGAITVDKPPLAIWPIALSVRLFGLSSWSLLVPQAVEGVASVALLYSTVRRSTGSPGAALLSGAVFASTPIAVLMFRYNNPDALLVLLMVAASYATVRALTSAHALWWLASGGALVGTAFMCKLFQAFMILPSLVLVYALFATVPISRRIVHLLVAAATTILAAGWWMATVELWPTSSRPWIGGSTRNSVLELALGYNGIGRLTGNEVAGSSTSGWHGTNLPRMLGTPVWTGVMWLVPAALILAAGAAWASRRCPQGRGVRAATWLWMSWFVVNTVVFCLMAGIFHSYYTIVLAPAVAALIGISGLVLWRARRHRGVSAVLTFASATTTVVAVVIHGSNSVRPSGLNPCIWALGLASAVLIVLDVAPRRAGQGIVGLALVAALLSPVVYGVATAASPHAGSGPQAGAGSGQTNNQVPAQLVRALRSDADRYDWVAAVPGARASSAYQLATGRPVIGVGGYKQTDPAPSVEQFAAWVADGRVHYYIDATASGPATQLVRDWVKANFTPELIGDHTVYDLTSAS
nr:glycosyltransferase family 39 protein [Aeromicrobium stalagmiti]